MSHDYYLAQLSPIPGLVFTESAIFGVRDALEPFKDQGGPFVAPYLRLTIKLEAELPLYFLSLELADPHPTDHAHSFDASRGRNRDERHWLVVDRATANRLRTYADGMMLQKQKSGRWLINARGEFSYKTVQVVNL